MSHEIRTPLNAIVGLAHLMAKTEMTPLQREYLGRINAASHELLGTISDVVDFSKLEAGLLRIEQSDFDLGKLVESVATSAASAAARKKIELVISLDPRLPRKVRGDALRLGQVLSNLMNAAIEAPAGSEVALCVEAVQQDASGVTARFELRGARCAELAAAGPGQRQAMLGLAVGKRLIELLGGTVGHCGFTLKLGVAHVRDFELAADLKGCRALVVDDSFEARAALSDMLAGMSVHAFEARSGFEAIDEIRRAAAAGEPFDLVYLDWRMPELDGFETASRIRALGLERPPEVLLVSAYGRGELMDRAAGVGIRDVLLKPVGPSTLFDVTMEALARRRALRAAPRAPGAGARAAQPPAALSRIRGARVLVVEDNEVNQLIASAVLEEAGVEVETAADGRAALDAIARTAYDLVFMDMQMPVMDGVAATRELRGRRLSLPVVGMTANAGERDHAMCMDAGMNEVLLKPIDPERIWECLLRWVPPVAPAARPDNAWARAAPAEPRLTGLPGVDVAGGLARVRGDEALYRSLLARFVRQHAAAPCQIQEALANGEVGQAELLAHRLRSVATNLGLQTADAAAAALEGSLRAYDPPSVVQERLRELTHCVDDTVAGLGPVLATS